MNSSPNDKPLSLFEGVDELAAALFGISSIHHWSAVAKLRETSANAFDGSEVVEKLFRQVEANWARCLAALSRAPSAQNWRWFEPKDEIGPENRSPEVTLERAIIRAALGQSRRDWSNQVPIASGVIAGTGNRRRAIDLVHSTSPESFEFVELKVGSDNPLFAAIEIFEYGFVWLLSRRDQDVLRYADRAIIRSSEVRLSVLAPKAWYRSYASSWLAAGLSDGIGAIGERNGGVRMSFAFEEFPPWFIWPGASPFEALSAVDGRRERQD